MAGRGIVVEVIGDDRSALRMWERQVAGAETTGKAYKKLALTATESANLQIAASVKAQKATQANILALRAAAARAPVGSAEQVAATALAADAQAKLARSQGLVVGGNQRFAESSKTAERDLNKLSRGVLSGSGILGRFSRSLAFASSGFIAFAVGAEVIKSSIQGAENLEKAQRSLDVAIQHTGGNVGKLIPKYQAVAKAAAQFGIDQADATTGLARATVLTGNAASAQRAYQEALVISKATGKDFNAVLTATAKGQIGVTTSLRRYGILVSATSTGQQQFNQVLGRFGGQAAANTTASEKLQAVLRNTAAEIGTELLPTFNAIAISLSNWLQKMTESGKLQKDVKAITGATVTVFRDLGKVIGAVDRVTGSFVHTIELLLALKFASVINRSFIPALSGLAAQFGLVTKAAEGATAAETLAIGAGAAGGAGVSGVVARTQKFTGKIVPDAALAGGESGAIASRFAGIGSAAIPIILLVTDVKVTDNARKELHDILHGSASDALTSGLKSGAEAAKRLGLLSADKLITPFTGVLPIGNLKKAFASIFGSGPRGVGSPGNLRDALGGSPFGQGVATRPFNGAQGPFGTAKPLSQFFKQFQLNFQQQLAQVQASLTRSTKDDVAAARAVVADIKKKLDAGQLHGQARLQALQLEASALSTIWSAEDAAAQQRAAKAQALKAKIQAQIENSINPIDLQLAVARDEAAGKSTLKDLERQRAAARRALASGKLDKQQQLEALNQITSLNQQIADARKQTTKSFTQSLKLQIALAKAQAFGTDVTPILQRMKAALLRALHSGKFHGQALIDLLNQISDINSQLNSATKSSLNFFKQLNTRQLTSGLGLTPEQRAALRARLSQIGPHGTVPGSGVGAAGFVIGADDRPIVLHHTTKLDGRPIEKSTTKLQQKRRRRNSSQRRGPNAGSSN